MTSETGTDLGFRMHAERTPNPNSIKWVLGRVIVEPGVTAHFDSAPPEDVSPLASRLFAIDGVVGVFVASNFTTVTKRDGVEEEIRPVVAMDGGDIVFSGFQNGIVELYMHGSCSGCPSSTATLKYGIETRLRELIPEVVGVVAL